MGGLWYSYCTLRFAVQYLQPQYSTWARWARSDYVEFAWPTLDCGGFTWEYRSSTQGRSETSSCQQRRCLGHIRSARPSSSAPMLWFESMQEYNLLIRSSVVYRTHQKLGQAQAQHETGYKIPNLAALISEASTYPVHLISSHSGRQQSRRGTTSTGKHEVQRMSWSSDSPDRCWLNRCHRVLIWID